MRPARGILNYRRLLTFLRVAGGPLLLLIILLRLDMGEIASAFGFIKFRPFAVATVMVIANFAMQIIKWGYLLSGSSDVTRGDLIRSVIGGYAFILATPGRIGEFSRALFIPGVSKLKTMGLVAIDKLSAFSIVILMSGFSLALFHSGPLYLVPLAIMGLLALVVIRPQLLGIGALKLSRLLPLRDKTTLFLEGIQHLTSRRVMAVLLMSLLYFLIYSTQFYLLLSAFEKANLRVMAICFPLVMLANSLFITVGGLGVREGAAVLLFTRFGVHESSALGAALLLFTINILIPGLCGLIFIHQIGTKPKPLTEKKS
jgi:uncharacterized membrane protein YbhN (UPF0104 family)